MKESESERSRRRWITVGELIAIAALIVSALGVWISWKNSGPDGPAEVIEQRQPIPLTLRGQRGDLADREGAQRQFPGRHRRRMNGRMPW